MEKFTLPPQLDDNIIESEKESELNYNYSSTNTIPIIKDGILYLFKVGFKSDFSKLVSKYNEKYSEVKSRVVSEDEYEKFYAPYARYKDLRYYETVIKERTATTDELERYLHLDEKQKAEFVNNNAIDIKEKVPVDEIHWQEAFRKEKYDEIIKRIASNTRVLEFLNKSKIAELIKRLDGNLDLSFIVSNVYQYITNTYKGFSTILVNVVTQDMNYISLIDYTSREKELPIHEKYKILSEVYDELEIEYLYARKPEDISEFEYEKIFGGTGERVLKIANMNSALLNDSEFSPIFKEIKEKRAFGMTPDECYESYKRSQEDQPKRLVKKPKKDK